MGLNLLKRYKLKDLDYKLIAFIIALSVIGIMVIGSAAKSKQSQQILGLILGIVVMTVCALIDYNFILQFYWLIYAVNIGLLIFVKIFGDTVGGATRWVNIFGITFQPSELSKILLILFYAKLFSKYAESISSLKMIVFFLLLAAVPLYLIKSQPDLSTTIVCLVVICVMIYMAGLKRKIVVGVISVAVPIVVGFLIFVVNFGKSILDTYQYNRIMAWIDPSNYADAAFQQRNSMIAIGSGQFIGKGLNNNVITSVKNGNFISEPQTDFIFAVAGEELGFVGACVIIILILLITLEILYIGKKANDLQGKLICCGMAALIGIQSFFNICVATGLMPNTGLPLPFVSYGLTSLVSLFIGVGIVINIGLQQRKY